MKEIIGDIWNFHDKGHWIVITTNGIVRNDGACVMGRGTAKEAAIRIRYLPHMLGTCIKAHGNMLFTFHTLKLITFPTKHHWKDPADPKLIEKSTKELVSFVNKEDISKIYLVRPGCNNGRLNWKDIKPLLEKYLDDRFIVVERSS